MSVLPDEGGGKVTKGRKVSSWSDIYSGEERLERSRPGAKDVLQPSLHTSIFLIEQPGKEGGGGLLILPEHLKKTDGGLES